MQTIAKRVADGLGIKGELVPFATDIPARTDLAPSDMLSILKKTVPSLKGKKVGCLVADGTDLDIIKALKNAVTMQGADFVVVSPKVGGSTAADGTVIEGDMQLAGGPSVLFDTVYLALSEEGATKLTKESAAVDWLSNAFVHLKVIGCTSGTKPLLDRCGVMVGEAGVIADDVESYINTAKEGRIWDREPQVRTIY